MLTQRKIQRQVNPYRHRLAVFDRRRGLPFFTTARAALLNASGGSAGTIWIRDISPFPLNRKRTVTSPVSLLFFCRLRIRHRPLVEQLRRLIHHIQRITKARSAAPARLKTAGYPAGIRTLTIASAIGRACSLALCSRTVMSARCCRASGNN